VQARLEGTSLEAVQDRWGYLSTPKFDAAHPQLAGKSSAERHLAMRAEARGIMQAHPGTYARIHLEGIARMLLTPGANELVRQLGASPKEGELAGLSAPAKVALLVRHYPFMVAVNAASMAYLLTAFVLAGFALTRRAFWTAGPAVLVVAMLAAYFIGISGGPESYSRFRHAVMPLVLVAGAVGLRELRARSGPSPA
jgi:hypothetical protein